MKLLFPVSLLASFAYGSWAFVFWWVERYGSYMVYEPVDWIRHAEFISVLVLCVGSLVVSVVALTRMLKRR